jgi:hypothetical protein
MAPIPQAEHGGNPMRATILVLSTVLVAAQAPAPATPKAPAPPAPGAFVPSDQPVYVETPVVVPAYQIAMVEANQSLPGDDPLIAKAAVLLSQLTAGYIEDAPRIAELTIQMAQAIRASNRPASPLEIMDGALQWKRTSVGNVPRKYEAFANAYGKWRVDGKKDHAQAMSLMNPKAAPGRPTAPSSR